MPDLVPIRRALISVSDKTDLIPFAKGLMDRGIEIVSTGGTHRALSAAGLAPVAVDDLTGFPEMMDGRVKTLHPAVHGGILACRDQESHLQAMEDHGILPIDIVCVNLYPFEQTIRQDGVADEEAIEQIDIGGPSMVRSAAKNHGFVTVITNPTQYDRVINELDAHDGCTSAQLRRDFATTAFARTAEYDATIAAWMSGTSSARFPSVLRLNFVGQRGLRYGENPHQAGAVYRDPDFQGPSVTNARQLSGKPLSYNNLLDAASALELVQDLHDVDPDRPAAAVIKHTNPCGAAVGEDLAEAFDRAYAGDPLAAFGGIVALSGNVDRSTASKIAEGGRFLEVVLASSFDEDAAELLAERWKNCRLLAVGALDDEGREGLSLRSIPGGLLAQERDTHPFSASDLRQTAGPVADDAVRTAAGLAWTVVKQLKSNAICIATPDRLLGAGAGQMDRVAACRLAVEKAGDLAGLAGSGPVIAASDAFFPFPDGPEILIDAGVTCLIHPGGSKRDEETFELCERRGVTCLLTGIRHFRH
ncbi:MAG: bifunctional phosphoribosylaminoimidazolecarboxamide formyltransferase/inosine monophosphate cyclohydrolase [Planctomycetaceae bacterium]|nr:bifunctional phosphoribosylaminoimidazolecarboxamide formyltransferase/inosine monophosphate cyclohydrolase [Planctomycetaceae bacterium]